MDASLVSLIPTGGVASVLVIVIVYLLRQNHADRTQYRADVAAGEARNVAEIKSLHDQHAADLKRVESELASLREVNERVLAELEQERRKRWHAEDSAAEYRRELASIRGATP